MGPWLFCQLIWLLLLVRESNPLAMSSFAGPGAEVELPAPGSCCLSFGTPVPVALVFAIVLISFGLLARRRTVIKFYLIPSSVWLLHHRWLGRGLLVVFIGTVFANKLLSVKCRVITTDGASDRPTCAKMLLLDCCRQASRWGKLHLIFLLWPVGPQIDAIIIAGPRLWLLMMPNSLANCGPDASC